MNNARYTWRTFTRECILLIGAFFFAVPLYVLVVTSLKSAPETYSSPLALPKKVEWGNYSTVWPGMSHALLGSIVITVGGVVCLIVLGSMAAYALARRRSGLSTALFIFFVVGIIIPVQLAVLPIYTVMRQFNLLGTYLGMIILWTGFLLPLTIFLYTGFIRALPRDYDEAAAIDGAGTMRTFFFVVFPLLRPVTGTIAILAGLVIWNDFFNSLIFLGGSNHVTLPVQVYTYAGLYEGQWNLVFAAVALSLIPILGFYVFAQRQLIRGFTSGVRG